MTVEGHWRPAKPYCGKTDKRTEVDGQEEEEKESSGERNKRVAGYWLMYGKGDIHDKIRSMPIRIDKMNSEVTTSFIIVGVAVQYFL